MQSEVLVLKRWELNDDPFNIICAIVCISCAITMSVYILGEDMPLFFLVIPMFLVLCSGILAIRKSDIKNQGQYVDQDLGVWEVIGYCLRNQYGEYLCMNGRFCKLPGYTIYINKMPVWISYHASTMFFDTAQEAEEKKGALGIDGVRVFCTHRKRERHPDMKV